MNFSFRKGSHSWNEIRIYLAFLRLPAVLYCVLIFIPSCIYLKEKGWKIDRILQESSPQSIWHDTSNNNMASLGIIHLGKCGGMALRVTISDNPSAILRKHPRYFHMEKPNITKYTNWIALVRDPLERFQSLWVYEHYRNAPFRIDSTRHKITNELKERFYNCYPTMNTLIIEGLTKPSKQMNDCPMLAKTLFEPANGNLWGMFHFRMNFGYYYSDLLKDASNKRVYVVQTKSMLEDLNKINIMMGGIEGSFKEISIYSHYNTTKLPITKRSWSPKALTILCKWLCPEIQIYKQLFLLAENYSEEDYMNSSLRNSCPDEVMNSNCEMPT